MKKTNQHILLFIFLLSSFFIQGQEISISSKDVLRRQKQALTEQRNFIAESACPQREDVLKEYQANFDRLIEVLDIVTLVFHTPITIEKDRIKEQGDKFVTYQSTNVTNVIIKRLSSKISMAGIVSDNSSIPVGARLLTETFTFKEKKIEVLYRIRKNKITLITLEAICPNKTRIYVEFQNLPQAQFRVYNTSEYGTENQNLQVLFSYEIGQINLIKTTGYELYPERYTEMITQNQGLIKQRYAIRCYDEKGNQITPTQKGNDIEIKPSTYLLWYKGFIGKYPIKLMLKRGFNKETNDERILDMAYGYDSKKKWISLHDLREPQDAILGEEKDENFSELDAANWNVPFEMNTTLKGDWNNLRGTILPITLTPMVKEFPNFTFKVALENKITPSGEVSHQSITALGIYQGKKNIQQISLEDNKPNLEYFELSYVDINYDGYLDLIVDNSFFLYNPTTKKFDIPKDEEGEWEYIPNLTELDSYNPYTKSFTVQSRRSFIEYRIINGKITPYESESYYPDEDGNMIYAKQKYINGKWKTTEKTVKNINDEEEEPVNDDIDFSSKENYKLVVDMSIYNKSIGFSPDFYNKTGKNLAFKQDAKLYVNLVDANGKRYQQYLYSTNINDEGKLMLDDNYILYNGKEYFLSNWDGVLSFFPTNIDNNSLYTFRLELKHPLFGSVFSDKIPLHLPLAIERRNIIHLNGNINNKVLGDLYAEIETKDDISATFINSKTDQRIKLKGTLKGKILNLEEYEKDDVVSGYFEGEYNNEIYKGYWISPDKKTKVPFEFKQK